MSSHIPYKEHDFTLSVVWLSVAYSVHPAASAGTEHGQETPHLTAAALDTEPLFHNSLEWFLSFQRIPLLLHVWIGCTIVK